MIDVSVLKSLNKDYHDPIIGKIIACLERGNNLQAVFIRVQNANIISKYPEISRWLDLNLSTSSGFIFNRFIRSEVFALNKNASFVNLSYLAAHSAFFLLKDPRNYSLNYVLIEGQYHFFLKSYFGYLDAFLYTEIIDPLSDRFGFLIDYSNSTLVYVDDTAIFEVKSILDSIKAKS